MLPSKSDWKVILWAVGLALLAVYAGLQLNNSTKNVANPGGVLGLK